METFNPDTNASGIPENSGDRGGGFPEMTRYFSEMPLFFRQAAVE